jgi:hypothetical protein
MERKRKRKRKFENSVSIDEWKALEFELDKLSVKTQRLELKRLKRYEKLREHILADSEKKTRLYIT